jgi:deazaflavin-dependent oxidoreductase (nitroreductase family)
MPWLVASGYPDKHWRREWITLPLLCIRDKRNPATFALVASDWGQSHYPAWYFNLKAHPRAIGSIRGRAETYVVHEASGEEYERFWQYAANTYMGYRSTNRRPLSGSD